MVVEQSEFRNCFTGTNGFEELKKYMRMGNDFCKDLADILSERAQNELTYAKNLNKTSLRLQKLSKDYHGNLSDAWLQVSMQFDIESDMHKSLSNALSEEIIKPMKILVENNQKSRKPVELKVEKSVRNFQEKKLEDQKYRTRCFQLVKDLEKSLYNLDEVQKSSSQIGKQNSKEIQKLEAQILKNKDYLEKSEIKYHKSCSSVELARQDWFVETQDACNQMQLIEADRLSQLEQFLKKVSIQMSLLSRKMNKVSDFYQNIKTDVLEDLKLACKKYGTTSANDQEMYLYDIYAENTRNMMNKDRRISNLNKWAEWFSTDVQAQLKAKEGLEKVKLFSKENPNFNSNENEINMKLESVGLLKTLYEISLFKIQYALAELGDNTKPVCEYSNKMNTVYDKQGVPNTILKLGDMGVGGIEGASAPSPPLSPGNNLIQMPMPMRITYDNANNTYVAESVISTNSCSSSSTISSVSPVSVPNSLSTSSFSSISNNNYNNRNSSLLTTATNNNLNTGVHVFENKPPPAYNATVNNGKLVVENFYNNSNQSISDEEDDSDWDDDPNLNKAVNTCMAQFDFKSTRDDEITIQVGDQIEILEKRNDGWWRGKLNDKIGLFPSTYVIEQT